MLIDSIRFFFYWYSIEDKTHACSLNRHGTGTGHLSLLLRHLCDSVGADLVTVVLTDIVAIDRHLIGRRAGEKMRWRRLKGDPLRR